MDQPTLVKYLRFLHDTADQVAAKEVIDFYDIASLRSELARFHAHLDGRENVSAPVSASLHALNLQVDDRWLNGAKSKRGIALLFLRLALWRSAAGNALEERNQERVRGEVRAFRNRVDHVRFAVET